MTGAQGCGDGCVAAGHLTALADPLNRRLAPILGEAERNQIQPLPWRNGYGVAPNHPTRQEPGTGGAESAVSIEDQNRQ